MVALTPAQSYIQAATNLIRIPWLCILGDETQKFSDYPKTPKICQKLAKSGITGLDIHTSHVGWPILKTHNSIFTLHFSSTTFIWHLTTQQIWPLRSAGLFASQTFQAGQKCPFHPWKFKPKCIKSFAFLCFRFCCSSLQSHPCTIPYSVPSQNVQIHPLYNDCQIKYCKT